MINLALPTGIYQIHIYRACPTDLKKDPEHGENGTFEISYEILAPHLYVGQSFHIVYATDGYIRPYNATTLRDFDELKKAIAPLNYEINQKNPGAVTSAMAMLDDKTFKAFLVQTSEVNHYIRTLYPNSLDINCEWSTAALLRDFLNRPNARLFG